MGVVQAHESEAVCHPSCAYVACGVSLQGAEYCASARCKEDCEILQVPIAPDAAPRFAK